MTLNELEEKITGQLNLANTTSQLDRVAMLLAALVEVEKTKELYSISQAILSNR